MEFDMAKKDANGLPTSAEGSTDPIGSAKACNNTLSFVKDSEKIGGADGIDTCDEMTEIVDEDCFDLNNDNNEDVESEEPCKLEGLDEFKKNAIVIVEEYFATDDAISAENELRDLGSPGYHYYFVKKLISIAMDRHDKEKEMAAVLLSTLYAEVIDPTQVHKGFKELVISCDDLCVDIPDAVDVLALFVARAVVDDILPPAFLAKQMGTLPRDSKGVDVIKKAERGYLSAPLHAEVILHRWGGSKSVRVDDVKSRISDLLKEYIVSGDKSEACRCIKYLKVPFFHHEIVKRALLLAMEKRMCEGLILELLKEAADEGIINESQMTKGCSRIIDHIDDLCLDIPNARKLLESLISKASSEGWLCASSLKSLHSQPEKHRHLEEDSARLFKIKITMMIQEYFLMGDILEVISGLESETTLSSSESNAIFVKRLITMAMGRKNREKEMASVLLPSLCFPADDVVAGFLLLIESAEDSALDHPSLVEDLGMFLARAVVDEVLTPSQLDEISTECDDSLGRRALGLAQSVLRAPLSSERILRCWGGGGSGKPGWELVEVKEKITKLLEEYNCGGGVGEACRCIKELGMPFFHHEVVKKALVGAMEKKEKNGRLWKLLKECFSIGLITPNQMTDGFRRVGDCMEDLVLDIPDAHSQYSDYVDQAKKEGWLEPCFPSDITSQEQSVPT